MDNGDHEIGAPVTAEPDMDLMRTVANYLSTFQRIEFCCDRSYGVDVEDENY